MSKLSRHKAHVYVVLEYTIDGAIVRDVFSNREWAENKAAYIRSKNANGAAVLKKTVKGVDTVFPKVSSKLKEAWIVS